MCLERTTIEKLIKSNVREVKDFPKAGISFKDITPLLLDPVVSKKILEALIEFAESLELDAIAGIDSRGFLFGPSLARALNIPFVLIRKKGKLPADTVSVEYDLEYGSACLEVHQDSIRVGSRVLIHDDLLATGGTAIASAQLVQQLGGEIAGFAFIIDLSFLEGSRKLAKFGQTFSLAEYQD
ncbi:adenine phosphoribosyltransferase [Kangiella sp. HZ709]|uniref:adenine phosphoribosyltransferase n=1 Tax=Kangiella sp. HZ709 TaxID=2666328 RepID=UPI0012AF56F1|nr:adenine phosphoribosyltransferase [Kangiella sp. HZ709]MRX27986.1 adenine phosphoribosyltransferase [Kangiella sp. HZ709]